MVEIVLKLDDAIAAELKDRAERESKSVEQVVTEAIGQKRHEGKPPLPIGMGEFDSGDPTLARRTREVIREAVEKGEWP